MKTNSYKDLLVWQKAMDLVEDIYVLTAQLPSSEKFGLTSQLQRAAVSVPSNIAEGYKRNNLPEYIQFCGIAAGSLGELETQVLIVGRIYKIDINKILLSINEVQRMLHAMIRQLNIKR